MAGDSIADFFAALHEHGHIPRLLRCPGSVRFEATQPGGRVDTWRVEIAKGDVTVSRDDGPADAVVRADKAVMEGVLAGEINPITATLRGVLFVEGNWDLLLLCQRLFGDPAFVGERAPAGG